MNNIKLYTGQITGKYVRLFGVLLSLLFITISCVDEPLTTDVIDNITGTWAVKETSTAFGEQNYVVTISKATDNSIYINGFYAKYKIEVDVDGLDLNIHSQTIDGNQFTGSGSVYSNYKQIDLDFTVNDGGGIENFTAVLKPK